MNKRKIYVDFPGGVYGNNPRLVTIDEEGKITACREASVIEYFLWAILERVSDPNQK